MDDLLPKRNILSSCFSTPLYFPLYIPCTSPSFSLAYWLEWSSLFFFFSFLWRYTISVLLKRYSTLYICNVIIDGDTVGLANKAIIRCPPSEWLLIDGPNLFHPHIGLTQILVIVAKYGGWYTLGILGCFSTCAFFLNVLKKKWYRRIHKEANATHSKQWLSDTMYAIVSCMKRQVIRKWKTGSDCCTRVLRCWCLEVWMRLILSVGFFMAFSSPPKRNRSAKRNRNPVYPTHTHTH